MPDSQYFYAHGNEQRGPVSAPDLFALQLSPATLVWREGMANWQRLDSVPELVEMMRAAAPQPQAAPFAPPPPPPGQASPFPPHVPYGNLPPRDSSKRILAGIFGILLGALGVHKFILGYTSAGLIMCLITIFTCGYAGFVFGIIGFIEGIIYLCTSEEEFYQRYVVGKRPWF
jgi:TM2 domain-containing membrane protein YozV